MSLSVLFFVKPQPELYWLLWIFLVHVLEESHDAIFFDFYDIEMQKFL